MYISGTFAKPAETFPNSFGKIQLFVEYPYLLPCSVSDTVSISALIACTFFFKEVSKLQPSRGLSLLPVDKPKYFSNNSVFFFLDCSSASRPQTSRKLLL